MAYTIRKAGSVTGIIGANILIRPGTYTIKNLLTHELGHAFGLWAHSSVPSDAMAPVQGASPVLKLSPRDQLTLEWMRKQPSQFGLPLPLPLTP